MTGLGMIVNVAGILVGCGMGLLLKGGLPKRLQDTTSGAVELCMVLAGITGALKGLMAINGGSFETQDTLVSVVCMAAGAVLGEWINIKYKLQQLEEWCKSRVPTGQVSGVFVRAFTNSSLLFCVGTMAIVDSLKDGLSYNYSILFIKTVMDGVLSVVFTMALGIGTVFSVFPVTTYQGSITLLAGLVRLSLTDIMAIRVSCIDSVLIFSPGLNLVFGSKIEIGDLLSAAFLPIVACPLGF